MELVYENSTLPPFFSFYNSFRIPLKNIDHDELAN